jgi:hypothetical protein
VLGQARLDGNIDPERESELIARLLRHWAWRSTVNLTEVCSIPRKTSTPRRPPLARLAIAAAH